MVALATSAATRHEVKVRHEANNQPPRTVSKFVRLGAVIERAAV